MKNIFVLSFALCILSFTSCKKSYLDNGGKSNPNVNMTTYEWLKSDTLFHDLVYLIDRAGLKETINGNITFFATTNYGVSDYVKARKQLRALELNDENITYTLDSIPLADLDSLKTYMFAGNLNRENLTTKGQVYNSLFGPIPNIQYEIILNRVQQYSSYVNYVDYIDFIKVIGTRDDQVLDQNSIPQTDKDFATDCQTTGIVTTTGIVHVLNGYHRLLFNNVVLTN